MLTFLFIVSWVIIVLGVFFIYCSAIEGGPSYVGWHSDSCDSGYFILGVFLICFGIGVNHSRTLTEKWQTEFMYSYKVAETKPQNALTYSFRGDFIESVVIKDSCSFGSIAEFHCGNNSIGKPIKYIGLIPGGTSLDELVLFRYRTRHLGDGQGGEKWVYIVEGESALPDTLVFKKDFQEEYGIVFNSLTMAKNVNF